MNADVTVFAKAFGDDRILYLASLLGVDEEKAFARMVRLWSACAFLQTDKPEARCIRACLRSPEGERHLVESGLGDDKHRDPSLEPGVVRVRGCNETDWQRTAAELAAQAERGRERARGAPRDLRGRFSDGDRSVDGDLSSQHPASDLCPDLRSDLPDLIRPELPDPQTIVRAERSVSTDQKRSQLIGRAWNYAATSHQELKAAGVDPHARNCWSGTNLSEEHKALRAIVADLTMGDAPDFAAAWDAITNRVDVAAAEARRDKTLRWFTPMRMWDAKSFARCAALTPAQAVQPRTANTNTHKSPATEPARRVKSL